MAGAARAREASAHFMVEEMEGIRLSKKGDVGVDHLLLFIASMDVAFFD
jgi:hypothetical protein